MAVLLLHVATMTLIMELQISAALLVEESVSFSGHARFLRAALWLNCFQKDVFKGIGR